MIFKDFPDSVVLASTYYDSAIFMPYDFSKKLIENQLQIYQFLIKTNYNMIIFNNL